MSLTDRDLDRIEGRFEKVFDNKIGRLGVDTEDPQAQRSDFVFLRGARRLWVAVLSAVVIGIAVAAAAPHIP